MLHLSIPLAARAKAWDGGRWLLGIAGSIPAGVMDVYLLSIVCCQVVASASG